MITLAIHQSHFMPWLGYLDKVRRSNVFVWLNHVSYRKNYFQNRNQICDRRGNKVWLTVPVSFSNGQRICDVKIAETFKPEKLVRSIEMCYSRAKTFSLFGKEIMDLVANPPSDKLDDYNWAIFEYIKKKFKIETKVLKSSEMNIVGNSSEMLVNICKDVGADSYIYGGGGYKYMDFELFKKNGIELIEQKFEHPVYEQQGLDFIPNMAAIDYLFNCEAMA